MQTITLHTSSQEETFQRGADLGALLKNGHIIALRGDLGSGKTHLTKGIGHGMGIEQNITSPTFVIVRLYPSSIPLYHVDTYRLSGVEDTGELGLEDLFFQAQGVVVVEWAEKIIEIFPPDYLDIQLEVAGETKRKMVFTFRGVPYEEIFKQWKGKLG